MKRRAKQYQYDAWYIPECELSEAMQRLLGRWDSARDPERSKDYRMYDMFS